MKKSPEIRRLLAAGKSVAYICERLQVQPAYVKQAQQHEDAGVRQKRNRGGRMVTVYVRMPKEWQSLLNAEANATGKSAAAVAREWMERGMTKREEKAA